MTDKKVGVITEESKAVEGELVGSVAEEANKTALKRQGDSIKRLIKQSQYKLPEIAKKIGITRQLIYQWQWGEQLITEDKLEILAKLVGREPAEVRYDIALFKQKDLYYVVREIERELIARNLYLDPEKKAYVVSSIFEEFQKLKRLFGEDGAMSGVSKTIDNSIEMLAMT